MIIKAEAETVRTFLKELRELFTKHNIIITGCGCCGSPFFEDVTDDGDSVDTNIRHLWNETQYCEYPMEEE